MSEGPPDTCTDLNANYIKKCKNNEFENQLNNLKIVSSKPCRVQSRKIKEKSDKVTCIIKSVLVSNYPNWVVRTEGRGRS